MGGSGGTTEPACGSAVASLDEAMLTEVSFDDGVASSNLRQQSFEITTGDNYVFNREPVWEATRFELEHPALIHGFKVMWSNLPDGADPKMEFAAGLYGDFGYNGYDFWAPDPLWTGTRSVEDIADQGNARTTYAFDQPIELAHPGLVYVAHLAQPGEPVWWFDGSKDGPDDNPCAVFGDCRSAFNLPEADDHIYYNGISFPFQQDFMVRLYVEYTDDVQPADKLFQQVPNAPAGGHVSWADFDEDGFDDLLIGAALWRNEGDGTFTDVSAQAGLAGISATGGVWGDYDNDGCLDVFLFAESYSGTDTLMKSDCNGGFADATAAAGIVDNQAYEDCDDAVNNTASPTAAAAWVDLDGDSHLDLYLANFICWAKESFYIDEFWHNQGDGTFVKLGTSQGFTNQRQPSRTVSPIDHDGDGDVDIMVGNYRLRRNQFFDNQGDGTVVERATDLGLAGTPNGLYYGHTIGLAWGDLDNDGDFDSIVGNLAHPRFFDFSDKTQVLINDGTGQYTDLGGSWDTPVSGAGLRYQETHSVPLLADFDNDGNLDLAITCVYDGRPSDFYWGSGDGTFVLDAYHAGITTQNGWGVAAADFDNDGDQDLFASDLFENTVADAGHWLQTRVVGVTSNRAAVGAVVEVDVGTVTYSRFVQGGSGKGGQDSFYLHFGIGDATAVDQIRVRYPGGSVVSYAGPIDADQRVWLFEDSTTAVVSWGNPNK